MLIVLSTRTQPFLPFLADLLGHRTWSTLRPHRAQSAIHQVQATFFTLHTTVDGGFPFVPIQCLLQPTTPSHRARAFLQSHKTSINMVGEERPAFTISGLSLCLIRGNTNPFQLQLSIYSFTRKLKKLLSYLVLRNEPPHISQLKWDQLPSDTGHYPSQLTTASQNCSFPLQISNTNG